MNQHYQSPELKKLLRGYPIWLGSIAVLTFVPLGLGYLKVAGGVFRDNIDVFAQFMQSPISLVFPLIASMAGSQVLYAELKHRGITNSRLRRDMRETLRAKFALSAAAVAVTFFTATILIFIVTTAVWPMLGNPAVAPEVYDLTPESAARDSLTRFSYSELLEFGLPVFGVFYAIWMAFSAVVYSTIGLVALLLFRNRPLAVALPFLLYLLQSIAVGIIDFPAMSLMFSAYPFGYASSSFMVALVPTLVLAVITFCAYKLVVTRADKLETLT